MTTSEQNEFEKRVSLLIDCGAMKDKNWPTAEVKHRTKQYLKLWKKMQHPQICSEQEINWLAIC